MSDFNVSFEEVGADISVTFEAGLPNGEVLPLTVTENGVYTAGQNKSYNPVTVAVPVPEIATLTVRENGVYNAPEETAYRSVDVSVIEPTEVPRRWKRPSDWPNLDLIDVSEQGDISRAYITIYCDGTWQYLLLNAAYISAKEIILNDDGTETEITDLPGQMVSGDWFYDVSALENGIHLIKVMATASVRIYLMPPKPSEARQQKTLESVVIYGRNTLSANFNTGNYRDWVPGCSPYVQHVSINYLGFGFSIEKALGLTVEAVNLQKAEYHHCRFTSQFVNYSLRDCTNLIELILDDFEGYSDSYTNVQPTACFCLETLDLTGADFSAMTSAQTLINAYCFNLVNFSGLRNAPVNQTYRDCTKLTKQSLLNIIDCLPAVEATKTLTLGSVNLAKLTTSEIAIATAKGWTVA